MFLVTDGYPYAFSVNVDIGMTPNPAVLILSTQPNNTIASSAIHPYTDEIGKQFLSFGKKWKLPVLPTSKTKVKKSP